MKKLFFTALVVAVFGFYFFSEADAQCDPLDEFCVSWFFDCPNCNMGSTTGSTVDCTFAAGGAINTVKKASQTATTGTFEQTGTAQCVHNPNTGPSVGLGTCDFEFSMSGVTLVGCAANDTTCDATASCVGTDPTVTGKLTCASRVLFFGLSNLNNNQCTNFFPLQAVPGGLAAGQLLHASFTKDGNGVFQTIGQTRVRGCNGDVPNVDCTPPGGVNRLSAGVSLSGVPFEFDFRQTVNTSPNFCKKGGIDKGSVNMDVFGSSTFSVDNIDVGSLKCNGAGNITCGAPTDLNNDGFLDINCQVPSCPTLGPALGALPRNPDGTVTATCKGTLLLLPGQLEAQGIVGVEDVAISPK